MTSRGAFMKHLTSHLSQCFYLLRAGLAECPPLQLVQLVQLVLVALPVAQKTRLVSALCQLVNPVVTRVNPGVPGSSASATSSTSSACAACAASSGNGAKFRPMEECPYVAVGAVGQLCRTSRRSHLGRCKSYLEGKWDHKKCKFCHCNPLQNQ